MGRPRINWQQIHNEYTTSPEAISKQDLADKYGINRTTLSLKATKEQWDIARASFLRLTSDKATEKKADAVSTFAAEWNGTCVDSAKRLNIKALAEMDAGGKVRDIAGALKIAQDMGKAAAGESPEDTLLSILAGLQKRYE